MRPPRACFTPTLLLQTHSPRRAQPRAHIPLRRPSLDRVPSGREVKARAHCTPLVCRFAIPSAQEHHFLVALTKRPPSRLRASKFGLSRAHERTQLHAPAHSPRPRNGHCQCMLGLHWFALPSIQSETRASGFRDQHRDTNRTHAEPTKQPSDPTLHPLCPHSATQ